MIEPGLPGWVFALGAGVPNLVVGVLLLAYRAQIAGVIASLSPRMTATRSWMPRAIVIAGIFLIAVPTFLIVTAIGSALEG